MAKLAKSATISVLLAFSLALAACSSSGTSGQGATTSTGTSSQGPATSSEASSQSPATSGGSSSASSQGPATSSETSSESATTSSGPKTITPLSVMVATPFSGAGYYTMLDLAEAKGYFRDEGVSVTLQQGTGSANTVQVVASGQVDVGFAIGATTVIQANAAGATLKSIASVFPVDLAAVISTPDKPIRTVADLRGKSYGVASGSVNQLMFQAILAHNNIPASDVKFVNIAFSAYPAALAGHRVDAVLTSAVAVTAPLEQLGVTPVVASFASLGIDPPGIGVVANDATIQSKPDALRGFVAALNKVEEYLAANGSAGVTEAVQAGMKAHPESYTTDNQKGSEDQLAAVMGSATKYQQPGKPIVYLDPDLLSAAQSFLTKYNLVKNPVPIEQSFTDQFMPKS